MKFLHKLVFSTLLLVVTISTFSFLLVAAEQEEADSGMTIDDLLKAVPREKRRLRSETFNSGNKNNNNNNENTNKNENNFRDPREELALSERFSSSDLARSVYCISESEILCGSPAKDNLRRWPQEDEVFGGRIMTTTECLEQNLGSVRNETCKRFLQDRKICLSEMKQFQQCAEIAPSVDVTDRFYLRKIRLDSRKSRLELRRQVKESRQDKRLLRREQRKARKQQQQQQKEKESRRGKPRHLGTFRVFKKKSESQESGEEEVQQQQKSDDENLKQQNNEEEDEQQQQQEQQQDSQQETETESSPSMTQAEEMTEDEKKHFELQTELETKFNRDKRETEESSQRTDYFMTLCSGLLSSASFGVAHHQQQEQQQSGSGSKCLNSLVYPHLPIGDERAASLARRKLTLHKKNTDRFKKEGQKQKKLLETLKDRATRHHLDKMDTELEQARNNNKRRREKVSSSSSERKAEQQQNQEEQNQEEEETTAATLQEEKDAKLHENYGEFLLKERRERERRRRLHHHAHHEKLSKQERQGFDTKRDPLERGGSKKLEEMAKKIIAERGSGNEEEGKDKEKSQKPPPLEQEASESHTPSL